MSAQHSIETTLAAAGSKATYGGASTSIVAWFLSSEFGMLAGLCIALGGLAVNIYFQHKRDKREQAEHERRMRGDE